MCVSFTVYKILNGRRPCCRYFTPSSGILQIVGVRLADAGDYRCHASSQTADVGQEVESRYSNDASLTVTSGMAV